MKKLSLLIAAFALVLGFSQCRKPNLPALNGETQHVVLNASWDNGGSKIEQVGSLLKWTEGDKLTVTGGATGELSCKDATLGTFEGTITKTTGGSITFTFQSEDYKENFKEQTGALADAVSLKSAELEYKADGNYGTVSMGMTHAVLKLDLSYFAPSPSKADVTVEISVKAEAESKEESVIASVKCASDRLGEVYVVIPANENKATYTFSDGSGKTVNMPWPALYGNTFFTAVGNGGAAVIDTPKFTVADGTTVEFAPGNLWYGKADGEETAAFHFEANQWDFRTYAGKNSCIGGSVTADGTPSGHWGLFGWSTDASSNNWGMHTKTNTTTGYTNGNFKDWGTASGLPSAGEGKSWHTLTKGEWSYLLGTASPSRADATKLRKWKDLGSGIIGLVILPDGTENPSTVFDKITSTGNLAQYNAVFLPAAGFRYGTDVLKVGSYGNYWSSTPSGSSSAYGMYFRSGSVSTDNDSRYSGYAVRLVR